MLVYDCEIIKCIPTGEVLPKYSYCNGWRDFDNMGISAIGYSDLINYWYDLEPFTNFKAIAQKSLVVVGFNSKQFDDELCKANGIDVKTDYDLLEEIRIAAFGSPDWQSTPKGFSYSLDAISKANGMAKTGHGALAPQLWQDGKHQEVIDYCLNDVKLTVQILELGIKGKLIDPNTGKYLKLKSL